MNEPLNLNPHALTIKVKPQLFNHYIGHFSFKKNFYYSNLLVGAHACHSTCMQWGTTWVYVLSIPSSGAWRWTQFIRLDGNCLFWLSHLPTLLPSYSLHPWFCFYLSSFSLLPPPLELFVPPTWGQVYPSQQTLRPWKRFIHFWNSWKSHIFTGRSPYLHYLLNLSIPFTY